MNRIKVLSMVEREVEGELEEVEHHVVVKGRGVRGTRSLRFHGSKKHLGSTHVGRNTIDHLLI